VDERLIYDVGFHKGEDTDFYLRKGFKVVAIEADPDLVRQGRRRFEKAIANGKLQLIDGAIAPASAGDEISFYANRNRSVWGTSEPQWARRNNMLGFSSETIFVKRVDIADLYRMYGIPFYLKIDVEGVDRFVVEELGSFKDKPYYVSLESEKVKFDDLVTEMELLKTLGYTRFKIVQQETIPGSKITTHSIDGHSFEYMFEPHASGPFGEDLSLPWLTYEEAIQEYTIIFRRYKYFGDYSPTQKMPETLQRISRKLYRMRTGYAGPLPGWYDTHASRMM
jgi:FkbM family methyltransferase